jgi:hypothetical protein
LATRSPRRGPPGSNSGAAAGKRGAGRKPRGPAKFEDVVVRAARLGITVEKVLREYARIAFADPRHLAGWDETGLHVVTSGELTDADVASIHEISGGGTGAVHLKLYDKKAALDAIARHLGMFPLAQRREGREEDKSSEAAEDPREILARELARLAARGASS